MYDVPNGSFVVSVSGETFAAHDIDFTAGFFKQVIIPAGFNASIFVDPVIEKVEEAPFDENFVRFAGKIWDDITKEPEKKTWLHIHKYVLDRRFAAPVQIDDTPYEIEVAVDAVIVDPGRAAFSVMMDPDLCARIEKTLPGEIRNKLGGFSLDAPYDEFGGPIHTAYLHLGFAYSMRIVDVRKLDAESEKITAEHSAARKRRDEYANVAPTNYLGTIQKLRKMDEEIECITQKLRAVYRTDVHPMVFECQRSARRFDF